MKTKHRLQALEDKIPAAVALCCIKKMESTNDNKTKMATAWGLLKLEPCPLKNVDAQIVKRYLAALPVECLNAIKQKAQIKDGCHDNKKHC